MCVFDLAGETEISPPPFTWSVREREAVEEKKGGRGARDVLVERRRAEEEWT